VAFTVSTSKFDLLVKKCIDYSSINTSSYVCVANVHMCIEAYRNQEYKKIVNQADMVTADGMPLVLALKFLFGIQQDRIAGMDLLPALLESAEEKDLSVFFYGGTEEMLDNTRKYIQQHYPAIKKHHYYSPPFRALTYIEQSEVVKRINSSKANLVFVALGCPKQEKWMASMLGKVNACMIGIGGALPVMIGMQKRAPRWMQQTSLEWLYRLLQEPQRLFKRYFITNSLFIYLFIVELIRVRLFKANSKLIMYKN